MDERKPFIKNTIILAIIILAISCTGRKEQVDEESQDREAIVAVKMEEIAVSIIKPEHIETYWRLNVDFGKERYIDNETIRLVKNYLDSSDEKLLSYGNEMLDDVQYVRLPYIDTIILFASYKDPYSLSSGVVYNYSNLYMLFPYMNDGQIVGIYERFNKGRGIYDIANYYKLDYDFTKDIQGLQMGKSSFFIGDFNNDGYDEIIIFYYDMLLPVFTILGHNNGGKLGIDFSPIFEANLPPYKWIIQAQGAPVQFGTYKGIEGFVLYENTLTGSTITIYEGPFSVPSEVLENEFRWNFYTWNDEENKFIFIDQIEPAEIEAQWARMKNQ